MSVQRDLFFYSSTGFWSALKSCQYDVIFVFHHLQNVYFYFVHNMWWGRSIVGVSLPEWIMSLVALQWMHCVVRCSDMRSRHPSTFTSADVIITSSLLMSWYCFILADCSQVQWLTSVHECNILHAADLALMILALAVLPYSFNNTGHNIVAAVIYVFLRLNQYY